MTNKREELIRRNENFVQIPMPNLGKMTDEELKKRANTLESIFEIAFDEDTKE